MRAVVHWVLLPALAKATIVERLVRVRRTVEHVMCQTVALDGKHCMTTWCCCSYVHHLLNDFFAASFCGRTALGIGICQLVASLLPSEGKISRRSAR
jgi:hypothetical protein